MADIKLKKRAEKIVELLKAEYPDSVCTLDFNADYQLLFAARLAAQCTDRRVNVVTKKLFADYTTLEDFAYCELPELEEAVRPCGFYKHKAADIQNCARMLLGRFEGRVPDNMEDLLSLPGVGRKTANLILGDLFGKPAVVVDTHCIRISNLLGLASSKSPEKIERILSEIISPEEQSDFCHRLVDHGRAVCAARKPRCGQCCIARYCESFQKT